MTAVALLLISALLQTPSPTTATPVPTDLELARVELVKKQVEINELQTKYALVAQELGQLKLAIALQQGTPKCGDDGKYAWDWQSMACVKK